MEAWFAAHQRHLPWRADYDPYRVWVSEVMLQQTRMEVVLRYYERFIARFPDVASLANATDREILASWSGLGYYRRARMLRDGARDVVANRGGVIPDHAGELQTIAGIGRYTAGAIASIAFDRRAPIVDGNVARILARLTGEEDRRAAWHTAEALVDASASPRALNQGLMEIGALVCRPRNPECASCPLTRDCFAFVHQRTASLPRKKEKASRAMDVALYIIRDRRGRVLMRRESGKLMNAMMHLPHGGTSLLSGAPLRVEAGELLATFRHTITTRRVAFSVYTGRLAGEVRDDAEYEWVHPSDLPEVPHPSYVAKALRFLR